MFISIKCWAENNLAGWNEQKREESEFPGIRYPVSQFAAVNFLHLQSKVCKNYYVKMLQIFKSTVDTRFIQLVIVSNAIYAPKKTQILWAKWKLP